MKKYGLLLFVLGLLCFGAYYFLGPMFSDVKVTFNSNGGTSIEAQVVKNGEKATEPKTPTKENATFVEWQLDGSKYDFNSAVTSNIVLDAKWNEFTMHNVKVTIDSNEYTTEVRDGEKISIDSLSIPSKDGYRITLYSGEELYNIDTPVTSDLELSGKYVEIVKYKVTFNSNGGSKVETKEVVEGDKVEEATTTRDGYDFDGWYLGNEKYDFTTPITKNITLKAGWVEKGKINVIFMVDDKVYKTIPVKEGSKVSKPSNPTKKGYKFIEWQLDGTKFDFNTKISSETTLTATFEEANTVMVKFDSNGGTSVTSQEIDYGSKAKKPSNPTKKDYKFVEWQLNGKTFDFNKEVTEDITLKAKWEDAQKYTVTFDSNGGGAVASQVVFEGEKAKAPTGITRSGYKLEGWIYEGTIFDFNTPITKNMTLTARWKAEKYTVTFNSNGGSNVASQTINAGGTATKPSNPTRSGYEFVSWQLNGVDYVFSSKVTKNIELKANWRQISYTFKVALVDEFSPDRTISVYLNGSKINFSAIKVNGVQICTGSNPTVSKYDIEGVSSVTVVLTNGTSVTAKLS